MRFCRSSFRARLGSWARSPQRVSGSLTPFHRSVTLSSVRSFVRLAMGVSLLHLGGTELGQGYALSFCLPLESTQPTVHYLVGRAARRPRTRECILGRGKTVLRAILKLTYER